MSHISVEIHNAQLLLSWLESWPEPAVSLPDIYQFGPNPIRDKNSARRVVEILVDHGWLRPTDAKSKGRSGAKCGGSCEYE
jgi:hypothetical protein